jgi:DNA-binding NtrC family response regulator
MAFILVWSADQPERVGEAALLDPNDATHWVLGRGPGEDGEAEQRVRWTRQRPGVSLASVGPLVGRRLSRRQLVLSPGRASVRVRNIGRARVEIDGRLLLADDTPVECARGAVVRIDGHSVFLVVRRAMARRGAGEGGRPMGEEPFHFGRADADGIVGESPAAWELRAKIRAAARTGGHVLVHGPSGTGKELVAHAIHRQGRGASPFVAHNAATIPSSLADSILFGNPRNYPNTGDAERAGLVGQAHGGTLFLDEIAELPVESQTRLLRMLEGEYTRVGESVARRAELRVVGATNQDLTTIRYDVVRRFSYVIEMPSLEERLEDVPLLARSIVCAEARRDPALAGRFVREGSAEREGGAGALEASLSQAMAITLLRMPFDGGVRDLRNALLRAMVEAEAGARVLEPPEGVGAMPPDVGSVPALVDSTPVPAPVDSRPAVAAGEGAPNRAPSAAELSSAMARYGWNVSRCAAALAMSRHRLQRMLRQEGIQRPR